jgi:hypothetical protein
MNGLYQLLIPIIKWTLIAVGAGSLLVIAVFILWWFSWVP